MTMKSLLLTLFAFSIFIFGFAIADQIKEPDIVIINDQLLVYAEVAEKFVMDAKANGLDVERNDIKEVTIEVKGDDDLFVKVVKLRDKAQKSGWIFIKCEGDKDGKNLGIEFDKEENLITDITLCRT